MSTRASRRVGQLRLRAPDAVVARRAQLALEDALHTASLPDAAGRLLLVRRLDLGRLDPRATTLSWAQRLEQAFARSGARCVHALDAGADSADAVWFRDALEAHCARARCVLRGEDMQAWFWRALQPVLLNPADADSSLHRLLQAVVQLPEAPIAVPLWLAEVDALGGLSRLARTLRTQDVAWLAEVSGVPGVSDAPARVCDSRVARESSAARRSACTAKSPVSAEAHAPSRPGSPVEIEAALRHIALRPATRSGVSTSRREDRLSASIRTMSGCETRATDIAPITEALHTAAGGLLFLLPVLARLGYPEWLARHPEWARMDLARRMLARVLQTLCVDPKDPAWTVVDAAPHPECQPTQFNSPARWASGLGLRMTMTQACAARPLRLRAAQAWQLAAQRWLRRYLGLSLRALVLRPAGLVHTPTHVELQFDHAQVDLRVRRAGLDLDPGWVAWFARVVSIGYGHREVR